MKKQKKDNQDKSVLRVIPSIQDLLNYPSIQERNLDLRYKKLIIEREVEEFRQKILKKSPNFSISREEVTELLTSMVLEEIDKIDSYHLKKVINGTGIILHTNLGRAPVAEVARQHLLNILDNYCNLEINLESGKRGDRVTIVEDILCLITGAEAAVVVNNNAAAILLALNSLCRNKEAPVSRGELVEIGGSFRMPEVMRAGQVKMVEVGTTNKTHLEDYASVINPRTGAILKVHTSNYRIMGFTDSVSIGDLVSLANQHEIPLIYDMGSGVLENLENWGYSHEPIAGEYIEAGVDVVTFSADKVLGGPQAGIIIGRQEYIKKIKKNHLLRALRCDKLTYALLDATLRLYLVPDDLKINLPVAKMLNENRETLQTRGMNIITQLKKLPLQIEMVDSYSQMGSGALPLEKIPSVALKIIPSSISVSKFARQMRTKEPIIVGYIENEAFFLNLRTIRDDETSHIISKINQLIH
jgi:L-seryl-tRNA(Ser) seleniumtransferase